MSSKTTINLPELSRPLAIEKIPTHGLEQKIEAHEQERVLLAKRFGLIEVSSLIANLKVHSGRTDLAIKVTGTIKANVVQQCGVTLEPLPASIEQDIDVLFASSDLVESGAGPVDPQEEAVEPILDGIIDLGELVAQHFGISLDPYPRKPGVDYVEVEYGDASPPPGPMAQLAILVKKPKESN